MPGTTLETLDADINRILNNLDIQLGNKTGPSPQQQQIAAQQRAGISAGYNAAHQAYEATSTTGLQGPQRDAYYQNAYQQYLGSIYGGLGGAAPTNIYKVDANGKIVFSPTQGGITLQTAQKQIADANAALAEWNANRDKGGSPVRDEDRAAGRIYYLYPGGGGSTTKGPNAIGGPYTQWELNSAWNAYKAKQSQAPPTTTTTTTSGGNKGGGGFGGGGFGGGGGGGSSLDDLMKILGGTAGNKTTTPDTTVKQPVGTFSTQGNLASESTSGYPSWMTTYSKPSQNWQDLWG